jgi:hypothetical protein
MTGLALYSCIDFPKFCIEQMWSDMDYCNLVNGRSGSMSTG